MSHEPNRIELDCTFRLVNATLCAVGAACSGLTIHPGSESRAVQSTVRAKALDMLRGAEIAVQAGMHVVQRGGADAARMRGFANALYELTDLRSRAQHGNWHPLVSAIAHAQQHKPAD